MLKWKTHADLAIRIKREVRREEYLDQMTFRRNERPLFAELFGPILGLKEEWEAQGASPAELDFSAFRYRCPDTFLIPVNTGRHGGLPEVVLEETDEHRIWRDGLGRTMKLPKHFATLPLPLDFPVKTMSDWLRIKPWYTFSEDRLAGDWQAAAEAAARDGKVVCICIPGGFDEPRELMGDEAACVAYYDQPELMHDILQTLGETAFRVVEAVSRRVTVDQLCVHEDMAGKSGPLVGPEQIREFIAPYYRRVWNMVHERGAHVFDQDSDGNMNPVIDAFLEAGVNCMHPMEPAAGMDIVQIREKYGPRLAFRGGIDKHVLRHSKAAIDAELERKLPPMIRTGGCVLGLDHRVPNGTPLANFRYYIQRVWEILGP